MSNPMLKTTIKQRLWRALAGRVKLQPLFEALHHYSLIGMHYGFGSYGVQRSGEKLVIEYLAQHTNKRAIPVVFDVGAHVGKYSLEVLSVFGKNVELSCFEPSKTAFTELVQKLSDYDNVKTYNLGFGEHNETTTLYSNQPGSGWDSVYARRLDHLGLELKHAEEIQLRRLDDFCRENGVNHIHLLKLDVEGSELSILKGAKDLIDSYSIDLIQFEFGRAHVDSRVYLKDFFYLLDSKYRIHRIVANGFAQMDKYKESYEIFMTTNYLAISRKR
jgi:FkbM family methyltransferase